MLNEPAYFPLLALPDACLLTVLQCCAAEDQRSVLSAAQTHSRLRQAAIAALCSISIDVREQQQTDSVLLYLDRHGGHVGSLKLWGPAGDRLTLRQLGSSLQLHSLELTRLELQFQPGDGFQGVLGAAGARPPPLKQLRLNYCTLRDGVEGLEAALLQLPALEHLSLCSVMDEVARGWLCFPTGVLQQLLQLTYLGLAGVSLQGPHKASPALQPLQVLTRLADLWVADAEQEDAEPDDDRASITAAMLSGAAHLTRLALARCVFQPGALAPLTKLQHLDLTECTLQPPANAAGLAVLLSQLQQQTQLTHLDLRDTVYAGEENKPPAAAFTALTASSKLQHLGLSGCRLPAGAWQLLFPAGRQLLHLTSLDISEVQQAPSGAALTLEGSRIVSCCPTLQSLDVFCLGCNAQQLAPLQRLSGLHKLHLVIGTGPVFDRESLQAVCQLTGLRELHLGVQYYPTQLLLTQLQELQQLQHLTALTYENEGPPALFKQEGPDDEPVWRQVLQLYLDDSNPDVAQQAAAALAQLQLAAPCGCSGRV